MWCCSRPHVGVRFLPSRTKRWPLSQPVCPASIFRPLAPAHTQRHAGPFGAPLGHLLVLVGGNQRSDLCPRRSLRRTHEAGIFALEPFGSAIEPKWLTQLGISPVSLINW